MSTRRQFMAGTVVAGGALMFDGTTIAATESQWFLLDYEAAHADRLAAQAAGRGFRTLAITGDRVRFAREVFGPSAPDTVGGVTTYADFILLTGCAAEAGYRVISERPEGTLVRWKLMRLRRATYSG